MIRMIRLNRRSLNRIWMIASVEEMLKKRRHRRFRSNRLKFRRSLNRFWNAPNLRHKKDQSGTLSHKEPLSMG